MKTKLLGTLSVLLAGPTMVYSQEPGENGHRPPPPPIFAILDTDHDGLLTAKELRRADDTLEKLDQDGDHKLTLEEFLQPPPQRPAGGEGRPPRRPPPPLIAALDSDKDGTISAAEIEAAAESLKALDQDGDGSLSQKEIGPPPPPAGPGRPPQDGPEGQEEPDAPYGAPQ